MIKIDMAIICICLPTLKAFINRHISALLAISSASRTDHFSQSKKSSMVPFNLTVLNARRVKNSCDKDLINQRFSKLEECSASNQVYAMTSVATLPSCSHSTYVGSTLDF